MNIIKKIKNRLYREYRQATASKRVLPDFIIIGAQKAGTTSLHHYLSQHPQLVPSFKKEVHFFDGGINPKTDNYIKGQTWYRSHFPLQKDISADQRVFESTPLYLFNPLASSRMYELIPQVKIIVLLRNPVERAISHYNFIKQMHLENRNLYDALQLEELRLKPALINKNYKDVKYIHQSYKSRGLYKNQLERYLKYFPRKQILFLSSEQFFSKPEKVVEKVFEFLEVDKQFKISDLKPKNVTLYKADVEPETYTYLEKYYLEHNVGLYQLLDKDLDW